MVIEPFAKLDIVLKQWLIQSIKLSVVTDNGVSVNNFLVVSLAKSNGMLMKIDTTSKDTIHSFRQTVFLLSPSIVLRILLNRVNFMSRPKGSLGVISLGTISPYLK